MSKSVINKRVDAFYSTDNVSDRPNSIVTRITSVRQNKLLRQRHLRNQYPTSYQQNQMLYRMVGDQ